MKKKLLIAPILLFVLCSFAMADWIVVERKDIGYKLQFPRKPESGVQDVDTKAGKLKMYMLMCDQSKYRDANMIYGFIYSDYPEEVIHSDFKDELIDTFFNGAIRGSVNNVKGTLVSVKDVPYKDYPGREIKIAFEPGIMYMRMYLVRNRAYMLQVGCETKNDNNGAIQKFFNSFELLN